MVKFTLYVYCSINFNNVHSHVNYHNNDIENISVSPLKFPFCPFVVHLFLQVTAPGDH